MKFDEARRGLMAVKPGPKRKPEKTPPRKKRE
jgi:hypothetical protein